MYIAETCVNFLKASSYFLVIDYLLLKTMSRTCNLTASEEKHACISTWDYLHDFGYMILLQFKKVELTYIPYTHMYGLFLQKQAYVTTQSVSIACMHKL